MVAARRRGGAQDGIHAECGDVKTSDRQSCQCMPFEEVLDYLLSRPTENQLPPAMTISRDSAGAVGHYRDIRLFSVFQALHARETLAPVAYEALLRARDENNRPISPEAAFALPQTQDDIVFFDRLCRVVHALNFVAQAGNSPDLYVNVSGAHLLNVSAGGHGKIFETLLMYCGLTPQRIVLEIVESRVDSLPHLQEAITAYKERGYRVAIDDFGCQHSNFDRLWQLTPDIVKLDRSLILQASDNVRARRILPKLIDIIHDLGALAVCEGIETVRQHDLAQGAGADLLQGYYYSMPRASLQHVPACLTASGESP